MKSKVLQQLTTLFIFVVVLFAISSSHQVMAQSGMPPLDSNCGDGECVFAVASGSDDAGRNGTFPTGCDYSPAWNEIYLGKCQNGNPIVSGFRFANITVPRGITITQAYLVFTVDGAYNSAITIAFYGEDSANAATFSSTSQPANRTRIGGAFATWPILASDTWVFGSVRQSPNITNIIQAIVNKSGWASGNSLVILTEPTSATAAGAYRRAYAFERSGITTSARLVIKTTQRSVYLPLMSKEYQRIKSKSGIHLGSGVNGNWSPLMQSRLTGGNPTIGIYPAVLVVLSVDIFNYTRSNTSPCLITNVASVKNQTLYNYLTEAALNGTKVIIRIYPSPGNFNNTFGIGGRFLLLTAGSRPQRQVGPGNIITADYCSDPISNDSKPWADYYFRSIDDIAQEMIVIRDFTNNSGWKPYAFEPANEINSEWWSSDERSNSNTWTQSDNFFKNLYLQVHPAGANPDVRVLAVPMAQSAWAEAFNVVDCSAYFPGWPGGLAYMPNTWMENVNGTTVNFNDGWSWHNYWKYGEELATANNACSNSSGHNFQAFPDALKTTIINSSDLAFITEADLFSPCIGDASPAPDKGGAISSSNGVKASSSLKLFISQTFGADYVVAWLLTNRYFDLGTLNCSDQDQNDEIAWHEAFIGADSTATNNPNNERYWFKTWWLDTTQP